jgi:hypothetical protein
MKTDITYIYALFNNVEPDIIRYVGKSNCPLKRLKEHITESKKYDTYKCKWLRSIDSKDLRIKILAICPKNEYELFEEKYIKENKSDKLTNSDESGQGNINRKKEIIDKGIDKISKKVFQFDLYGNFITEFKSVREASRQLNIDHSQIARACNGIAKHSNGFIFKYNKDIDIEPLKNPNSVKKTIIEIDSNNNIINEWISIMECSRDTKIDNGNLSRVCNGKRNHIKGRFFRFK